MRKVATPLLLVLLLAALAVPPSAQAERYDPRRSGHPLRITAYALHPVGWLLDTLIFHPAWWIGGFEPFRTLSGRAPDPEDEPAPTLD